MEGAWADARVGGRWQSSDRHTRLRTVMGDRPDLVESELAGLAFDATQELFNGPMLDTMFAQCTFLPPINSELHLFIDPAAGGPQSDYAIMLLSRFQGQIMVRPPPPPVARAQAERGVEEACEGVDELAARVGAGHAAQTAWGRLYRRFKQ